MNCRYGVQFYVIIVVVDLQSNVKRKGNKSYRNMIGLLVIAHVLALCLKQHTSHGLLDKHFANDETRSHEQLCSL